MASNNKKPAKRENQSPSKGAGSPGFRMIQDGKRLEQMHLDPLAARIMLAQHTTESMSGPLPPSAELDGYERTLSGAADRVLKMAELEQEGRLWENKERIRLDEKLITGFKWRTGFAQFAALILVLAAFYVAHDLSMHDHDTTGSIIGGTTIAAILAAFLGTKLGAQAKSKKTAEEPE